MTVLAALADFSGVFAETPGGIIGTTTVLVVGAAAPLTPGSVSGGRSLNNIGRKMTASATSTTAPTIR